MRKKVDSRIRTLVENCVALRQRCLFVIVGDKGREQVVNLHYLLSKTVVKARPSVLWCYKKDLYLSRHVLQPVSQLAASTSRKRSLEARCYPHAILTSLNACSHRKKRMKQIKRMMQRGLMDPEKEDPFTLFVASTNIRYCFYSDSHKILGNTYGMCVLQVRS